MKKFIGAMTLGLMLLPGAAVLANDGGGMGDGSGSGLKIEHQDGFQVESGGSCSSTANQKARQALQAAKQVYQQAVQAAQSKFQSDKQAAQALTDINQRELAMEAAQFAKEDAQIAAQAVLRTASRAVSHQQLLDRQACRAQQSQVQACVKTANQKAKDAMKEAEDAYKSNVEDAKSKLESAKHEAEIMSPGDARDTALETDQNDFEDSVTAAQATLRTARRAAQAEQRTDRNACGTVAPATQTNQ